MENNNYFYDQEMVDEIIIINMNQVNLIFIDYVFLLIH